ncbi:MAG: queuosine precursor transporter [bacterium]
MTKNQQKKFTLLTSIFITALVAANLLGSKITVLAGISVSVAIFAYPLTFLVTDIVEEVLGKKVAKQLIVAGFLSLFILLFLTWLSVILPAADRYEFNNEYKTIFSSSLRMIIASLVAFLLSQFHDVWAFNFWKEKTKGKLLWLRNNFSTVISQFIDTSVFMFIAFYMITPKFDVSFIISLIIPYWLFKIAFAVIDTPFVYLGVKWLKEKEELNETK